MLRKLALSFLGALTVAAPASAAPIPISIGGGQTAWMFSPLFTGGTEEYFVQVERQDRDGDILLEFTNVQDDRLGYAWVDCSEDLISVDGDDWEYVDHRTHRGWWSDIACSRPVR